MFLALFTASLYYGLFACWWGIDPAFKIDSVFSLDAFHHYDCPGYSLGRTTGRIGIIGFEVAAGILY
jgi:hypothetical protein